MSRHQFTREQVYEMADALSRIGSKDTEFEKATSIAGGEIMTIVQDGTNKQLSMTTLFAKILELIDPEQEISLEGLLKYWDGTSEEYEAITGGYSDDTLYFIKETGASVISKLYKGSVPIRLIAYVQPTFSDFYLMDASGKLVDVTKATTYNVTKVHVVVTNKACLKGTAKLYYNTNVAGYQVLIDTIDVSQIVDDVITLDTPQQITLDSGKSASFYLSAVDEQNETVKSNTFSVKCNYSTPSVTISSLTLKSATPTIETTMAILDKMTLAYGNTDYLDQNGTIKVYTKVGSTSSYSDTPVYTSPIYKDGAFVTSLDMGNDSSQGATTGVIQGCTIYTKVVVTSTTGDEVSYEITKTVGYSTLSMGSFTVTPSVSLSNIYYLKDGTTQDITTTFDISGFTNYENLRCLLIVRKVGTVETTVKQIDLRDSWISESTLLARVRATTDSVTLEPQSTLTYYVKLMGLYGSSTVQTKTFGETTYNIGMWKYIKTAMSLAYTGGSSIAAAGATLAATVSGGKVYKSYYDQTGTSVHDYLVSDYTDTYSSSSPAFAVASTGAVTVAANTDTTERSATIGLTRAYSSEIKEDLGDITATATLTQKGVTVTKTASFTCKYNTEYTIGDSEKTTIDEAMLVDDWADYLVSAVQTSAENATEMTINIPSTAKFFGFIMPSNITVSNVVAKNTAGGIILDGLSQFTYDASSIGNIYHLGVDNTNGGGTIVVTYTYK